MNGQTNVKKDFFDTVHLSLVSLLSSTRTVLMGSRRSLFSGNYQFTKMKYPNKL